jgi:protein-disulfide isomerase
MASRAEEKERAREERLAAEATAQRHDRRRAQLVRLGLVGAIALVVVIVAVVVSGGSGSSSASKGGSTAKGGGGDGAAANALFRGIPQRGVTLGDSKAKATLVEFADLQCPYCKQYSDGALPTVIKRYVRPGTLRYELRLRSFLGPDSVKAAGAAAIAAQQGHLYQFADLFYRRQGEENSGYVTSAFLRGIASSTGVDPAKALAAAAKPSSQPLVAKAEKLASDLGSNSTPAFYLRLANGRYVPVTPQTLAPGAVTQAIDAALKAQ